jgi:transcriptional regulator with XRE-family HTH domain
VVVLVTTEARKQRLRLGLTLRQLAERCKAEGVSVDFSQLARIERGDSVPNPALRATLARLLDLDVTDFERRAS